MNFWVEVKYVTIWSVLSNKQRSERAVRRKELVVTWYNNVDQTCSINLNFHHLIEFISLYDWILDNNIFAGYFQML